MMRLVTTSPMLAWTSICQQNPWASHGHCDTSICWSCHCFGTHVPSRQKNSSIHGTEIGPWSISSIMVKKLVDWLLWPTHQMIHRIQPFWRTCCGFHLPDPHTPSHPWAAQLRSLWPTFVWVMSWVHGPFLNSSFSWWEATCPLALAWPWMIFFVQNFLPTHYPPWPEPCLPHWGMAASAMVRQLV